MRNRHYIVRAKWDGEARVWVATSPDVPGLVAQAETFGDLRQKLFAKVPELLGTGASDVALSIIADRFTSAA